MSNQAILRITREITDIQKNTDLSIAVACLESDVRNVKALIIGPPDTPYEFGFFDFSVVFPKGRTFTFFDSRHIPPGKIIDVGTDYPGIAPSVIATTTNSGRCRFNPNIYAGGKVCLSILGTWRGERGEEWSSAQGLESILISIQSLMSSNPYENEPGYENAKSGDDKKNISDYADKIQHESLRISIIQRLEGYLGIYPDGHVTPPPPLEIEEPDEFEEEDFEDASPGFEPFVDLCKRRFLWYYDSYLQTMEVAEKKHSNGENFRGMPFEGPGNSMDGKYDYAELRRRLQLIRRVLDDETKRWIEEGAVLIRRETSLASQMQRQYEQMVEIFKANSNVTLDIDLVEKNNPFAWRMTYFGRPMTHLDGGMFQILMTVSPRFPEEQPRVRFETPLFHHRIAKDGTLCYFPKRSDELRSHLEAIIEAIEQEHPAYDPRTLVNPEASRLFWGSADDKKNYNRQLRRSVQRSTE